MVHQGLLQKHVPDLRAQLPVGFFVCFRARLLAICLRLLFQQLAELLIGDFRAVDFSDIVFRTLASAVGDIHSPVEDDIDDEENGEHRERLG
jgi:hypothetical protein